MVEQARAVGRARLVKMPPASDLCEPLRRYLAWAGVTRAELFTGVGGRRASRGGRRRGALLRGSSAGLVLPGHGCHAAFPAVQQRIPAHSVGLVLAVAHLRGVGHLAVDEAKPE